MSHFQTSAGAPELSARFGPLFAAPKRTLASSALYAWLIAIAVALPWILRVENGLSVAYHLDVDVYRQGTIAFLKKAPIYDERFPVKGIDLPFTYPPFGALVFAPFAWLSLPSATLVLDILTAILTWWSLTLVAHALMPESDFFYAAISASWIMPLAFLSEPIRDTISFGQVNVFLMALVLTDVLLPKPKHLRWTTGILVGMAAAIKLTPLVFGLYFVVRKQRREAIVTDAAFLGWSLLAYIIYPAASKKYWLSTLSDTSRIGRVSYPSNQSFQGFFSRVLPETLQKPAWDVAAIIAIVCISLGAARINRQVSAVNKQQQAKIKEVALLSLISLLALQASPVSWSHHWVWLLPLLMVTAASTLIQTDQTARQTSLWLLVTIVGAILLPAHLLFPHENGIELHLPMWIRFMVEPYLLLSIIVVVGACLCPWTLVGSEPPQNRKGLALAWKRFNSIIAIFVLISGQIGASSSIYPWLFM